MKVFVAGATGAIGQPLVRRLVAEGHEVTGTTRTASGVALLSSLGATPARVDALDAAALRAAVLAAAPEVVVHQLTSLPRTSSRRAWTKGLQQTGRLRRETVPALLDAAIEVGARRAIVQSISFITKPDGNWLHDEASPLWTDGPGDVGTSVSDVAAMEESVCARPAIDSLVLRYGFYYGPGTSYSRAGPIGDMLAKRRYPVIGNGEGRTSFVHIDDAVDATVRALTMGDPGVYNITDGEPTANNVWVPEVTRMATCKGARRIPARLAALAVGSRIVVYAEQQPGDSSAKAQAAFDWHPRSWREGWAAEFSRPGI